MKYYYIHIAAALLLTACGHKKKETPPPSVPLVMVTHPSSGKISTSLTASGIIASSEEIALSFKSPGMVEQVLVEEGQIVQKGQLLARLNTTELDAQLSQATLNVEKLNRDESRTRQLVKDTIATLEQLQNIQTSLSSAAEQERSLAFNRQQAFLYAPAQGIILKRQVNPGEFKGAGATVFMIGSNTGAGNARWAFKVALSDKDRVMLREGQQTTIKLDAFPEKELQGTVSRLDNIPDAQTGTYNCYVTVDPAGINLVYGLSGKMTIPDNSEQEYSLLPLESFVGIEGNTGIVYTVNADTVVQRQTLHILQVNGKQVALQDHLPTDMQIITSGKNNAIPGRKVQIK